ncbi:MAG: ABZJ_00895 family protein [Paracoccaceae bacterium]|nr:ABZJ_00895 family protein [Paracoccaceae bacterium]
MNLLRYTGIYVLTGTTLMVLSVFLERAVGIALSSMISMIVPPLVAALLEGKRIARVTMAPISNGEAWRAALAATAVVAVLNVVFLGVWMLLPQVSHAMRGAELSSLGLLFAVLLGVVLLINRIFLTMGSSQEMKLIARQSEEG